VLEKMSVYNELSRITTNQSEDFNTLLKHYGNWPGGCNDSQTSAMQLKGFSKPCMQM